MEQYEKLSIYIPKKKAAAELVQRLEKIGAKKDRSVNHLVVEAIEQYVQREREE